MPQVSTRMLSAKSMNRWPSMPHAPALSPHGPEKVLNRRDNARHRGPQFAGCRSVGLGALPGQYFASACMLFALRLGARRPNTLAHASIHRLLRLGGAVVEGAEPFVERNQRVSIIDLEIFMMKVVRVILGADRRLAC